VGTVTPGGVVVVSVVVAIIKAIFALYVPLFFGFTLNPELSGAGDLMEGWLLPYTGCGYHSLS
jgi:dolichyl-phosphate-mannose--protein O-mannosyl transferase